MYNNNTLGVIFLKQKQKQQQNNNNKTTTTKKNIKVRSKTEGVILNLALILLSSILPK